MPHENTVTNTDAITNIDSITNRKVADTSNIVSGNKNASSQPSLNTLFVYDKTDTSFAPFAKHLAKAYYPGAKLEAITSVRNLAAILSKYSVINTLVIFTHSTPGSLLINGVIKTSTFVNAELAKSHVKINSQIVFEGCEIMIDPIDTCKMIASIAGSNVKVIGYSYYTITQIISFDFSGTSNANSVQNEYNKFDADYWLPGLPSASAALGKKFSHGRRWFRDILDTTVPEGQNFRRIESLSSLGKATAGTHAEAKSLEQNYNSPVYSGDIITVSNVASVVKGKP